MSHLNREQLDRAGRLRGTTLDPWSTCGLRTLSHGPGRQWGFELVCPLGDLGPLRPPASGCTFVARQQRQVLDHIPTEPDYSQAAQGPPTAPMVHNSADCGFSPPDQQEASAIAFFRL